MVFGLFSSKPPASPEADFWKWFQANEARLFSWENDREATFNALEEAMHNVDPNLTFEISPVIDGKREFVISADGIQDGFPAVEALYASAPSLERWTWVKFRPRRLPLHDIEFAEKSVRADEVHFLLARDDP